MEFNFNTIIESEKYGCYLSTYDSTYDSSNANGHYDEGKAYQFFDNGGVDTTLASTASASDTDIVVSDATGISIGMRISGESVPADTYVTNVSGTTITISNGLAEQVASGTNMSFYTYSASEDRKRSEYSPLSSVFEPNRPDPGIINLFAYRGAQTVNAGTLKAGNFGNASGGVRADRVYPIYKDSRFRYWSSVRKVLQNNVLSTVGVSNSSSAITHAAPFVVYSEDFFANKITVKTQKYNGYPVDFKVEYLDMENNWVEAYSVTSSTTMSDGILNVYYNGTSWGLTEATANELLTPTDSVQMQGVRFSVTKMNSPRTTLDVIEISPRLQFDVSDYLMSFSKSTAIDGSISDVPASGIISGSGSLSLFNGDKYFSVGTSNSILSNILYPGVEIRVYQTVNSEDIKIGTFYVESWNDSGETEISANLEDYFYFLKRQKAPNISIANISGIETSVAILILLDNAGITNYEYIKAYEDSRDDFVMDFFFCSDEQTVADVLGDIALSSQCTVFVDANNTIKVFTKEFFNSNRSIVDTDFWVVGSEDWTESDTETAYLDGEYVSNAISFSENKIMPITEMSIEFAGNGIKRAPKAILNAPELLNEEANPFYNASIVSRDISYVNTELWSIDSAEDSDKVLLSMPYISEITTVRPAVVSNGGDANNINDLIRDIYSNATATEKKYFEIVLDQERGIEFLQSKKFNGYVMINSELIKYNGIVVDVFDPVNIANSGRKIVFNNSEAQYIINSASSGVSVLVYSLLVELVYKPSSSDIDSDLITYTFVSDGRAQENTQIASHAKTSESIMSTKYALQLFANSVSSAIKPSVSLKSESINLSDPRNAESKKTYSYPGYLKLSGPKGIKDGIKKSGIADALSGLAYLPIDNYGERFITGVYQDLGFTPNVLSTRMRLLEKPAKKQSTKPSEAVSPENRGIAGLAFKLKEETGGFTGYFVELEDVGNITGPQIENEIYTNLRLYKVSKVDGKFVPQVLKTAWVNVNATAGESIDLGNIIQNEGKSYASTSDIQITISEDATSYTYKVFWETNLVINYKENKNTSINQKSTLAGVMARFDSVALFDHFLALSVSNNGEYRVPTVFSDGSKYVKALDAAERGVMPSVISEASVSNGSLKYFFEDFGNQVREAKKYNVKFSNPAIYADIISLDKINREYAISNFSSSSYGAEFWVFNTSRGSIGLSLDSSTPVIISGIALESLNPGEILLSEFLRNKSGDVSKSLLFNKNKYGENSISYSAKFINNLSQAENILEWIWEKRSYEKKSFSVDIFPNPLLEIGDKIRIFDSALEHKISKIGDKCYYITGISYNIDSDGPKMGIAVEEV